MKEILTLRPTLAEMQAPWLVDKQPRFDMVGWAGWARGVHGTGDGGLSKLW